MNEKAVELTVTEGRLGEMLLEKYDPNQFHVIVPTHVVTIPEEIMELEVSVVHISPNPKDMMVYSFSEAGSGMMALAKRGIEAIANAAGLKDVGDEEIAYVPGQYAIVKATVSATLPNGEVILRTRSKNIDVQARIEEYEYTLRERIEAGRERGFTKQRQDESDEAFQTRVEGYVEKKSTKRRLHLQKFMWELANTGAHLRAMQALLPSLKQIYHINDLQKPFIVPRISVKPAVTQNKLLAAAIKARAQRDMHLLFDQDDYSDLTPERAERLRERDALLAELADDHDNGVLLQEEPPLIENQILAEDADGFTLLQEAYRSTTEEAAQEAKQNDSDQGTWPRRPWKPAILKRYLHEVKLLAYTGIPQKILDEELDLLRTALSKLTPDFTAQQAIISYLWDVESVKDLTNFQCFSTLSWVCLLPPKYEPTAIALEEAKAVLEECQ